MTRITNFIKGQGVYIIAIIIVVVFLLFFIYRLIRKKRLLKKVDAIELRINDLKTMPIQYRLGRVQNLAKSRKELAENYENYANLYGELDKYFKEDIALLLNEVEEDIYYKKFGKMSKKIKELDEMIDDYEQKASELLSTLEEVTEIENVLRLEAVVIKEKYNENFNQYRGSRHMYGDYANVIDEYFNSLSEYFIGFEKKMNSQEFDEAMMISETIHTKINDVHEALNKYPDYIIIVKKVIPQLLDKVVQFFNQMKNEGFWIMHLDVSAIIEQSENRYQSILEQLNSLAIDGIADRIEDTIGSLEMLYNALEVEWDSRNQFNELFVIVKEKQKDLNELFEKTVMEANSLENTYQLDNNVFNLEILTSNLTKCQEGLNDLIEKVESEEFVYVGVYEDAVAIDELIESTKVEAQTILAKCEQMRSDEKRAYEEIKNMRLLLLEIQAAIRNKQVPMIHSSYQTYITDAYSRIADINKILENTPIDLDILNQKLKITMEVVHKLYDNAHNLIVTAELVENTIVYGNRYRSEYHDVNTELTKAEVLFRNGEYTKALTIATNILENIQPGVTEKIAMLTRTAPQ